jgi:hypothetical protein
MYAYDKKAMCTLMTLLGTQLFVYLFLCRCTDPSSRTDETPKPNQTTKANMPYPIKPAQTTWVWHFSTSNMETEEDRAHGQGRAKQALWRKHHIISTDIVFLVDFLFVEKL